MLPNATKTCGLACRPALGSADAYVRRRRRNSANRNLASARARATEAAAWSTLDSFCCRRSAARRRASSARDSSMSSARLAESASTVTSSGRTSRKPPDTKKNCSSPSLRTFTVPGLSGVNSGMCCGRMPSSPSDPGATTKSASPLKRRPSTVTMSTCSFFFSANVSLAGRLTLGGRHGLVDGAHHVEGLFRQVVVLPLEDLAEATDRLFQRHVLARPVGEDLGDEERLRQEALDLAGPRDQHLVVLGQLIWAEDGDDVLQLLVALQYLLHAARHAIVLLADDVGREESREGVQRIDRRVDAALDDRAGEAHGSAQVGKCGRDRRVRVVVRGHEDRLHRGDRALLGGGDALFEVAHLGGQRGLVADRGR